jgi:aldehyde dehydrogenase (NAD+)
MHDQLDFYVDGRWVPSTSGKTTDAVDPSTEKIIGHIAMASAEEVDSAVQAARRAFPSYSQSSREERIALLERLHAELEKRSDALAQAQTDEMGAQSFVAAEAMVPLALGHIAIAIDALKTYEFEQLRGNTLIRHQAIGVCALITPWNFPAPLAMSKVAPALAVGATIVLKPSVNSSFSAAVIAEAVDAAGFPPGVFNLITGSGATVGEALAKHPEVDMVSITGSVSAGAEVARNAAASIKRVHQELGGKSPNVILESADLAGAVDRGVRSMMYNAGQICSAPSRMIVPTTKLDEVIQIAKDTVADITVGSPDSGAFVGPVVNKKQWDSIQGYIQKGIDEGATLITGGVGLPDGITEGYYVKPTVFANVTPKMTIAQEEIFGPVLVIQNYSDIDNAVEIANDTEYGLAAYLQGGSIDELRAVASRIPAGQVYLNGSGFDLFDPAAPFGGFGRSGNGREWGPDGFEAYLETVAFVGHVPQPA